MEVEEFSALFERPERSAFRVEARDRYDVDHEGEEFAAFLEGKNSRPRAADSDPWLALVGAGRARRRVIERVRIVSEPLTDYTRFEFAAQRDNVDAGEKVRVVPRAALAYADQAGRARISGSSTRSWWSSSYDERGRFLRVQQPKDIRLYLEAKQRALSLAVDFQAFVAEFKP
ncbi:MAG: DUF6879 family protein [Solirubrobacteraceae bacterium]